jgi:hypothetical protein
MTHHSLREERWPTVGEIRQELRQPRGHIGFCRWRPSGDLQRPYEVWIEHLAIWLRYDGSHGSAALRGHHDFDLIERWLLRRALRRWHRQNLGTLDVAPAL